MEIRNTATVLDGANILANAVLENGGNIMIRTNGLFENHDKVNAIDASSELGLSGTIKITTPNIGLTAWIVPLTEDFLDVDSLSHIPCAITHERGEFSTFHVVQREGVLLVVRCIKSICRIRQFKFRFSSFTNCPIHAQKS